uniref:DUF362 domain-containing protein n=1 Tax=Angiostrongylus cantonensis TaxID=6313 RepID=A0A0K0DIM9_ANGCA
MDLVLKNHAIDNWKKALDVGWTEIKTGDLNGHRVCMPEPFGELISHIDDIRIPTMQGNISRNIVHTFYALKYLYETTLEWPREKKRKQGHVEHAKQPLDLGDLTPNDELSNITLAYAAPGGVMEMSKSGPRTISVMILNKIANVSIDNAVVYPIVYPKGIDHSTAFKEGVPFLVSCSERMTKNTTI